MTTFRGPLNVIREQTDATVAEATAMTVEADGTALFTGAVHVANNLTVSGNAVVSGKMDSGAGTIVLEQSASVAESMTAATQLISVPNCRLHDVLYKRVNAGGFGTAASTINILIGTSGDDDQFGSFPNVSAQQALSLTEDGTGVSGASMHFLATQGLFVKVTAASGAVSGNLGSGLLSFIYSRR